MAKPEPIQKTDVMSESKIKQTSAAMLTLCKVLPMIIGRKVPDGCVHWINFLRLVQITFLATCPLVTSDTVANLRQLVATHNLVFAACYPKSTITPKMHYLVHLPDQMLKFGPLQNQWCMRFEAKHAFFTSLKLKCFKNLPKSLAAKHQLWMCSKQLGALGAANNNFLYVGDIVPEGEEQSFSDLFPDLKAKFLSLISTPAVEPIMVYIANTVKIHGLTYSIGSVLVTGYDHCGLPAMALLKNIVVYDSLKYFVVEELQIDSYEVNFLSFSVSLTGTMDVVKHASLYNVWPLTLYCVDNMQLVMNIYGHISELLM